MEKPIESERDFVIVDKWHILTHADLLQPAKPPIYLVKNLIRLPSLICFYGSPGTLKTMLMLDLAISVASGQPWLIPSPLSAGEAYPTRQGPVFILDQESGINRLQERIGALCRGRGVDSIPIHAVSIPNPPFNAYNLSHTNYLADRLKEVKAVFCIVDSLCAVSGGIEENSSSMAVIMRNLRLCSENSGATIVIVHHPRKGSSTETGGREGDRLRGHGSIESELDLAVFVDRKEGVITLKQTKERDDPWPHLQVEWGFARAESGALLHGLFWGNGIVQPKSKSPKYVDILEKLPGLLKGIGKEPSQNKLCKMIEDAYGYKKSQGKQIIELGVKQGILIEESTGDSSTSPKKYRTC